MKLKNSKTASTIFTISFIVVVFILFFISSLSYRQVKSLSDTEQLVMHTYSIQVALEQLFSATKDAETGVRGFSITKDSVFLEPYFVASKKVDSIYIILDSFINDNSEQSKNLIEIKPIINKRFKMLDERLENEKNSIHGVVSDTQRILAYKSKNITDTMRQHINKMIDIENLLLEKRKEEHETKSILTPFLSLLLLLFSLIIFTIAFYKINSDIKKLRTLNNELILTKESFEHAEEIGNISHWEWNLETNKLTYYDNQYLLLGCEPGEFEPTLINFLNYVHPDDRHIVVEISDYVLSSHQSAEVIFRIITKDGKLKYFKSTGRIITDDNGKKILIGINYDITDQHLSRKALEDKNTELLQSNIELASFNYIASHDLQEPLRKIQLIISIIFEDPELSLSEKNLDYFKRIQTSARRMQVLIDDLLSYSKITGTDKKFEPVDLNNTIASVLQEIAQLQIAEQKNATINYKTLPTVQGITFQLQQLFANLIGNSLKYSDPNRAPVINIQSVIVNGSDVPDSKADKHIKYHKITVSDNGMGFEQEYAEQIFALFQRLHDKQTFSGTGIGLAICKKVVENHHGFITANGQLNQGATFDIFFPILK